MLRDYQIAFIERLRQSARSGHRAICGVMPTGAGKTRTCGEIVRSALSRGHSALWLATEQS